MDNLLWLDDKFFWCTFFSDQLKNRVSLLPNKMPTLLTGHQKKEDITLCCISLDAFLNISSLHVVWWSSAYAYIFMSGIIKQNVKVMLRLVLCIPQQVSKCVHKIVRVNQWLKIYLSSSLNFTLLCWLSKDKKFKPLQSFWDRNFGSEQCKSNFYAVFRGPQSLMLDV